MSLMNGRDEMLAGATEIGRLPAFALFSDNARTVTQPLSDNLRELIAAAGNAHGLAEGYFRGSQTINEDGDYVTEEEKQKEKRRKIAIQSTALEITSMGISAYNRMADSTIVTKNMYEDMMSHYYDERRVIDSEVTEIKQRCDRRKQEIDTAQGQIDDIEDERTDADTVVSEAKTEEFIAGQRLQMSETIAEIFDKNLQRVSDGTAAIGRDGMVYDVTRDDQGNAIYSYENEGGRTIRVASPELYTPDELEEISMQHQLTIVEKRREAEAATENLSTAEETRKDVYQDTAKLLAQLREKIAQLEAEQAADGVRLAELETAREQLNQAIAKMTDDEIVAKLESGELTIGDVRENNELLERLQARTDLEVPAEKNPQSPYNSLVEEMEEKRILISQMKETEAKIQEKVDFLDSQETKEKLASGQMSSNDVYSYMGEDYMADYAKRYPSVVRLPASEQTAPNMTPIPDPNQNMTPLPTSWYSQVQSWLMPSAAQPQTQIASAETAAGPIVASSEDGLGISRTANPTAAFSSAATGQTPNMSTVTPEMMAQARMRLADVDTTLPVSEPAVRVASGPVMAPPTL